MRSLFFKGVSRMVLTHFLFSKRSNYTMSTTIQSFNHMLGQFVDELAATFPEYPQITLFKAGLPTMLESDPGKGVEVFMTSTQPHGDKIMQGDESFFDEDINLGMGLNLKDLWHAEGLDTDSKKAIFSYVSTLFVLGTTIKTLDVSILNGIEDIAKEAVSSVKESGSLDMGAMLPQMMSKVGALMGVETPDPNDPKFQNLVDLVTESFGKGGMFPQLGPSPTDQ